LRRLLSNIFLLDKRYSYNFTAQSFKMSGVIAFVLPTPISFSPESVRRKATQ